MAKRADKRKAGAAAWAALTPEERAARARAGARAARAAAQTFCRHAGCDRLARVEGHCLRHQPRES